VRDNWVSESATNDTELWNALVESDNHDESGEICPPAQTNQPRESHTLDAEPASDGETKSEDEDKKRHRQQRIHVFNLLKDLQTIQKSFQ